MEKFLSIFKHMNFIDWVLAAAFAALVSYAVYLVFPPYGWMFGLPASLLLLYIAKHRRDRLSEQHHKNQNNH